MTYPSMMSLLYAEQKKVNIYSKLPRIRHNGGQGCGGYRNVVDIGDFPPKPPWTPLTYFYRVHITPLNPPYVFITFKYTYKYLKKMVEIQYSTFVLTLGWLDLSVWHLLFIVSPSFGLIYQYDISFSLYHQVLSIKSQFGTLGFGWGRGG